MRGTISEGIVGERGTISEGTVGERGTISEGTVGEGRGTVLITFLSWEHFSH